MQPYADKHPGKFKVLGTRENKGVAYGIVAMTRAAKGPYFLFLEHDFQAGVVVAVVCVEFSRPLGIRPFVSHRPSSRGLV